jgi:hypothetical protein
MANEFIDSAIIYTKTIRQQVKSHKCKFCISRVTIGLTLFIFQNISGLRLFN